MKSKSCPKTFTMIELIIAIAVISILAISSFWVLTNWIVKSRDSKRMFDINGITVAIQMYYMDKNTIPTPNNYTGVYTNSGNILRYQGEFDDKTRLSFGNIENRVLDPQGNNYGYSVASDTKHYQVNAVLEKLDSYYMSRTYAQDLNVRLVGNYNEYIVTNTASKYHLWHIPSLFTRGTLITGNVENYIYQDKRSMDNKFLVKNMDVTGIYTGGDKTIVLSGVVNIFSGENIDNIKVAESVVNNAVGGLLFSLPATVSVSTGSDTDATTQDFSSTGFTSIVVGNTHTCGIGITGGAFCWGRNGHGQVGDGTRVNKLVPTAIGGSLRFQTLSAGIYTTCGISSTGGMFCWGYNAQGAVGDGTTDYKLVPTYVGPGFTWQKVYVGRQTSCGISSTGGAFCWGQNTNGTVGDGTTVNKLVPTAIGGSLTWKSLSAGTRDNEHRCGISSTGGMFCWGWNNYGQVGDGTTVNKLVPTAIGGSLTWNSIYVSYQHTCGISSTGGAFCWGRNGHGQIGDGTRTSRSVPTPIGGTLSFQILSTGLYTNCGISSTGGAFCWGYNANGAAGDGTTDYKLVPTSVKGGMKWQMLSAGFWDTTCGITTDGLTFCWGENPYGQVGNGMTGNVSLPTYVGLGLGMKTLSVGYYGVCGNNATGTYCWGQNNYGQVGDNTIVNKITPTLIYSP